VKQQKEKWERENQGGFGEQAGFAPLSQGKDSADN